MLTVADFCRAMDDQAPLWLAESWDAVGLLVGDPAHPARRVMTCLTITPEVVDEARMRDVNLIITHHPLPFRPLPRVISDDYVGGMVWRLIQSQISVYSPHTAWDSATHGINQMLAEILDLGAIRPLHPASADRGAVVAAAVTSADTWGGGRWGILAEPASIHELIQRWRKVVGNSPVQVVGPLERLVTRVAVACGSGGSFLSAALRNGCDLLVTGEANLHTCLEGVGCGMNMILVGHYESERFAMERLAKRLAAEFSEAEVWVSEAETSPLQWVG